MWSWEKEFGEGTEDNEMSQGGGGRMRMNQRCEGTEELSSVDSGEESGLWKPNASLQIQTLPLS